jgi:hypothetical protein
MDGCAKPTPKFNEIFPNWPNLTQIGAIKPTMSRISAKFENCIKPRTFDRLNEFWPDELLNFSKEKKKNNFQDGISQ